MKRINNLLISILSLLLLTGCYRIDNNTISVLPYRFVDKNEAVELYKSNDNYFDSLSEYDIQYRTQNKEGTIESLKEYGASQIRDFTDTEKDSIISAMEEIEEIIKENGYQLPKIDEIVFIKSTQNEEGGSVAYTHGSHIYE